MRIGSAKKNQNSCTSGGVVRKTSITALAGQRSRRDGESRISASTRPSGTPKASAAPVTFSVLRRPSASRSAFAHTGAKFQTCIGGAGEKACAGAALRLAEHLLHHRRRSFRVEAEADQELLVPLLRLAVRIELADLLVDPLDPGLVDFLSHRDAR